MGIMVARDSIMPLWYQDLGHRQALAPLPVPFTMVAVVKQDSQRKWHGRSRGGPFLIWSFAVILPYIGWRGAWLMSHLVGVFYFLFMDDIRRSLMRFHRRLDPKADQWTLLMRTHRHLAHWGRCVCDHRLTPQLRCLAQNYQVLRDTWSSTKGAILLSAHVGNWELMSGFGYQISRSKLHMVRIKEDDQLSQAVHDKYNPRAAKISVIDPRNPLQASMEINAALTRGESVAMLADRSLGGQDALTVPFFGGKVAFPAGPFIAAALSGAPIIVCFYMKLSPRHYRIEVDDPWYIELPRNRRARRQALEDVVAQWAKRLETQVRRFPLQWHNAHDPWEHQG